MIQLAVCIVFAWLLGAYASIYVLLLTTVLLAWANHSLYNSKSLAGVAVIGTVPISVGLLILMWGTYFWYEGVGFSVGNLFSRIKDLIIR